MNIFGFAEHEENAKNPHIQTVPPLYQCGWQLSENIAFFKER